MNKKFAVVNAGGKCRVLEEKIDPLYGNKDYDLWQVTDFKQYYSVILPFVTVFKSRGLCCHS
jgi:hypothetical protein